MKTIIELFVFIYKKLIYIYDESFISKMINKVFEYIGRLINQSYIGSRFLMKRDRNYLQKSSFIYKAITAPLFWIKNRTSILLDKSSAVINDSIFLKSYNTIVQTLLNISTKFWGTLLISLSIFYLAIRLALIGSSLRFEYVLIIFGVFILGLVLYLLNNSIINLIEGSTSVKVIKVLTFQVFNEEAQADYKTENIKVDISLKLSLLIGFFLAVLCNIASPLIISVVIVGIIGVAVVMKRTIIGVFLTVGLAPILPTMATLGLVGITTISFISGCLFNKDMKFKMSELGVSIILLVVTFAYSMITSFSVKSDINIFLLTSIFILFYFVFINTIQSKKQLYNIIAFMLVSALFVSLYGIFQNYTGGASNQWTDKDMFGDIGGRVTSTLSNPNVLGEYLILFIPLSFAMIYLKKGIFSRLIFTGISVALCICLVFTYSRGCWLGILLGLAIFFLCADKRFMAIGIVGLLTLPVVLPQNIINRFTSIGNLADTSSSYRLFIWMGTLRMLKDYWYSGIGLGEQVFNSVYPYYSYNAIVAPHPHNLYLQLMTQVGIIGLLIFVIIMIKLYRLSIIELIKTKSKEFYIVMISIISGISAFLLQSMFDNTWYNYRIILIFITFIAMGAKVVMLSRQERANKELLS